MGKGMKLRVYRQGAAALAAAMLLASGAAIGNRSASAQSTSTAPAINALTVCPVAGVGRTFETGPTLDGPAAGARISQPSSVAVTTALASPQVFVTEGPYNQRRIRKIDTATGQVTTVAGTDQGTNPGGENLPATSVSLSAPMGLAVTPDGSVLYFAESVGNVIRKVDLATGILTTVAGQYAVISPVVTDGPARSITLSRPTSLTLAGTSLSWADGDRQLVQTLDLTTGLVAKIAGGGDVSQTDPAYRSAPGVLALSASLTEPNDLVAVPGGLLIVTLVGRVYRYTSATGRLLLEVGSDSFSYNNDDGDGGPATSAHLGLPVSIAVVGTNTILSSGASNRLRVSDGTTINAFAGAREMAYVDDPAGANARFAFPMDLATDQFGAIYVADSQNNRVRKISPTQAVTTLAGAATPRLFRLHRPTSSQSKASHGVRMAPRTCRTISPGVSTR
jgi:trimeric autotransporter adhesin